MKIPETVKVGPYTYTVKVVDDLCDEDGDRNRKLMGQARHHELTILIRAGMPDDQTRETFMHEVLHALDYAGFVGLKEKQVHRLSVWLVAFLRDNNLLREEG